MPGPDSELQTAEIDAGKLWGRYRVTFVAKLNPRRGMRTWIWATESGECLDGNLPDQPFVLVPGITDCRPCMMPAAWVSGTANRATERRPCKHGCTAQVVVVESSDEAAGMGAGAPRPGVGPRNSLASMISRPIRYLLLATLLLLAQVAASSHALSHLEDQPGGETPRLTCAWCFAYTNLAGPTPQAGPPGIAPPPRIGPAPVEPKLSRDSSLTLAYRSQAPPFVS